MSRPLFNLEDVHAADNAVHRQWRDLSAELAADGTATGRLGLPDDGAAPAERCLIPLLREMRWQGNDRLLFEHCRTSTGLKLSRSCEPSSAA